MNQASLLFLLQSQDNEISTAIRRIDEIEHLLQSDISIRQAEERLGNIQSQIHLQENEFNRINRELQELNIKIKTSESMMYSGKIQNPKELQDLQHEIDSLKKRSALTKNNELEIMLKLDGLEQELAIGQTALKDARSNVATQSALLNGEKSKLESELRLATEKRETITNSITVDNLQVYQRLYQSKRGVAVAKIQDDACSACGTNIRPAEKQAANNPQHMAFCSSCNRILFTG